MVDHLSPARESQLLDILQKRSFRLRMARRFSGNSTKQILRSVVNLQKVGGKKVTAREVYADLPQEYKNPIVWFILKILLDLFFMYFFSTSDRSDTPDKVTFRRIMRNHHDRANQDSS